MLFFAVHFFPAPEICNTAYICNTSSPFMNNDSFLTNWINSPYYALYHQDELEQKNKFLQLLVEKMQFAKGNKTLQVGCGTGEQSQLLANEGFDVTGVDFSFKAISEAKSMETDNLHFFQHDIRLPFWINYFDYALNLFTSFGRFVTLREHENMVRVIAQSLKLDGLFVLDYINIQHFEDQLAETQEKAVDDLYFETSRWDDEENFYEKIKVTQNGFLKDTFTDKLAKLSIGDLTDMFAYQGLQVQEIFGDYELNNFDLKKSPRLIISAKKIRL
jgi:hypothetical protein